MGGSEKLVVRYAIANTPYLLTAYLLLTNYLPRMERNEKEIGTGAKGRAKHENLGRTKQTHKKPGKNETILYHSG